MSRRIKLIIGTICIVYFCVMFGSKLVSAYKGVCTPSKPTESSSSTNINTSQPDNGIILDQITVETVSKSSIDLEEPETYLDEKYGLPVISFSSVLTQKESEYYVVVMSHSCEFCKEKITSLVDFGAKVYLIDAEKEDVPVEGVPYTYKVSGGKVIESKLGAN